MKLEKVVASAALVAVVATGVSAQDVTFYNDKSGWDEGFQALSEGASEASGLSIAPQMQTPTDRYQAFVQSSIAGNDTPPIFTWWNGKQLESLVETGRIADLTEVWDAAIEAGNYSQAERDLFTVDGTPYAIPLNVARWPVLYSYEAFEAAGIENPPETWDELIAAADALKEAGYVPFNAPNVGGWMGLIWFSELMIRTDPDAFVGLTDGSVPYNGPEVQRAMDIWVDFYEKGYFTDPREQDETRFFVNGDAAMYLIGEWTAGILANRGMEPGEDFGAFIMPTVDEDVENSIIIEAAPIVMSAEAMEDMPELSEAASYLMSPEAGNALGEANGIFNGNLLADAPNPIVAQVNELMAEQEPRGIVRWWEAVPPDLQGDLVSQMGAFMLDPTAENAQRVMDDMEALNADYWMFQ
ncbi:ABC transporter substrate-binding protein [Pelagovum pacificum]|uniref:Extracellular solute-binding protein n=1 Tax=Pelagovum pacificum TaxID=2588711 RepID=A0A5C5GET2_9RHOB|nr:extracellular solute-binding protein [Pelagovum pacificum]QQA43632.1 extracellular solute-binding protein [Pelagovum pacificum]TNY33233.1 extracellular solute-binding protein [Pelagovum pacificum]